MTQHEIILHLSLCEGVGPILIQRIITFCGDNLADVYRWKLSEWQQRLGLSEKRGAQIIAHLAHLDVLVAELAYIARINAQWMSMLDQRYPGALRTIHAPPAILYWLGSGDLISGPHALAVIGSRAANSYGAAIIHALVPPLVQAGFTIISGGALGADSMAHQETLRANGKTIVVLGSGLLHLYPRTNVQLFQDIIKAGGTLVTPFPMNMAALPTNFPARNRIIAGLSRGCIVVQATEKSGTRITADFALQQGREVFVVPGKFDDPLSVGCHILAREGATLVTSAAHICKELGVLETIPDQLSFCDTVSPDKQAVSVNIANTALQADQSLSARIISATRHVISIEDLALLLSVEQDLLQQQLWDLQWNGKVQQDFTGRWYSS